jgi:hypothetical protein
MCQGITHAGERDMGERGEKDLRVVVWRNIYIVTTVIFSVNYGRLWCDKKRIFVSICLAMHLSNFATFFESRDLAWRQKYAVYFTLK